ncbi:MAG TPA: hypothetical protein VGO52_07265 [Hyphomonadaceae bacterium]|nr:hypothetical protein [Hyphomonadaceae bacterium]
MRAVLLALALIVPAAAAQTPSTTPAQDVDAFFDRVAKRATASKQIDAAPRNGRTLTVEHPGPGILRLITHGDLDKGARPVLGVEELKLVAPPDRKGKFTLTLTRTAGGKQTASGACTAEFWTAGETRISATIICPGELAKAGQDEPPPLLHAAIRLNPGQLTISMQLPKSKQSYIFLDPAIYEG